MRRAFTLIEVLIAIALLMALVSVGFGFLQNLLTSRAAALEHAEMQLGATVLLDRLEEDLLTSLVGDSRDGAGVAGNETSIRILSRGVYAGLATSGANDPRILSDLQRSEFRFKLAERIVEARKFSVGSGSSNDRFWPIANLPRARFRYHDGSMWRDRFDSLETNQLPAAVEVAIWFHAWPGDEDVENSSEDAGDTLAVSRSRANDENLNLDPLEELQSLDRVIPPPDRIRIITIPDSDPESEESIEFDSRTEEREEVRP